MDKITEQYQQEANKQFNYIDLVSQAFQKKCQQLKEQAEAALAKIPAEAKDQQNLIKLQLRKDLNQVLSEFEKEMRRSFGNNLMALEAIYHQKELIDMEQLTRLLQTV
ncbi:MAG: hypothetical protein ACRCZE_04485 [Candidatus Altimarinota bacterium]|jgi:hypothetical protein